MARVSGFRGIRYDPAVVQLESVLSPPYDVIQPELQLELYGRAMQNMVRLELGRDYPEDLPGELDRYTRARDHLRVWLAEGVLVQDDAESLYVHRHAFQPPGRGGPRERLGCLVGVEPVPHQRREVLRHELTLSAPREDRIRLLRTMGVQTSPILLLYEDSAEVSQELEASSSGPALAEAVADGEHGRERHQLWRLSDPEAVRRLTQALSRTRLFIADGHHRYETALTLGLPRVLALVAPLDSPGNVILPTHRVVPEAPLELEALARALADAGWEVAPTSGLDGLLEQVAALRDSAHAFGVVGPGGRLVVHRPHSVPAPDPRAGLDVAVLDTEILEPLLGITPGESEAGRLIYRRDPQEAEGLARGRDGLAFLVNPTTVAEMAEVALAGQAMPQKSTYFFPKVPAGLVLMESG